jgi:hypothetical protein
LDDAEFEQLVDWRRIQRRARILHVVELALIGLAKAHTTLPWCEVDLPPSFVPPAQRAPGHLRG